ncbi:hypothetical protein SKAU_G00396680 [Synaphobranchus kaupii]|uniref:Bridge-like lipid transfer protein family member 1 C-terminal domain-containing protein n=1 Tax=Synaphobranchus kaupii TaxID=118154 RepID=A0A9Q1ECL3_SYNKA|nr:hypothetical protein SKAU_G00396680 [Synaphobranchus kaupii]
MRTWVSLTLWTRWRSLPRPWCPPPPPPTPPSLWTVVVYVRVQPSQIRFSCLPMSRVECMLKLPSLDLVFSSNRGDLETPPPSHPTRGALPGVPSIAIRPKSAQNLNWQRSPSRFGQPSGAVQAQQQPIGSHRTPRQLLRTKLHGLHVRLLAVRLPPLRGWEAEVSGIRAAFWIRTSGFSG